MQTAPPRSGPAGGVQFQANAVRRWRWDARGDLLSAPVRCKREQWYLAHGVVDAGPVPETADVILQFLRDGTALTRERVRLCALDPTAGQPVLLGWVLTPEDATHFELRLPEGGPARRLAGLVLHPVAERDPKCHPLASVPRWSTYAPPLTIERVVLPAALEPLADKLGALRVETIEKPRTVRRLLARAAGGACVIDPAWVREPGLKLEDVERLAARCCVLVDLGSFATLVREAGAVPARCVTYSTRHEIMSARVEYADAATRGFAMQDVFPLTNLTEAGAFQTRVLKATGAWKRYADRTGLASLLSSETPWENKCGDVLCAARPIGRGELLVTDLPWLVAGRRGPLLAPHLAEHLLRMHLGQPLADWVQYWNHWQHCDVLVRDVSEMPRRHPPLRAVRWRDGHDGTARLGIALASGVAAGTSPAAQTLFIRTGRIDALDPHDGAPPEPLVIFMKNLAREVREQTRWARRYLHNTTVIWQFDTADGLRYALAYDSAAGLGPAHPARTLRLRAAHSASEGPCWKLRRSTGNTRPGAPATRPHEVHATVPASAGIFGDRSLEYQAALTLLLRRWIERPGAPPA